MTARQHGWLSLMTTVQGNSDANWGHGCDGRRYTGGVGGKWRKITPDNCASLRTGARLRAQKGRGGVGRVGRVQPWAKLSGLVRSTQPLGSSVGDLLPF
jgi:hypothetical protein